MTPNEMRELVRREPFVPFRLHLIDETTLDINNPRLVLVTDHRLVVGIPRRDKPDSADHCDYIGWSFIKSAETLTPV